MAAQIVQERPFCLRQRGSVIIADESMRHQCHTARFGIMAVAAQRLAVDGNMGRHLFNRLAQQMGQHIGAQRSGEGKRVGIACGGDPQWEFGLKRTRKAADFRLFSTAIAHADCLAAP